MKVYESITELVGKTPIVELKKYKEKFGLKANIYVKLEYFNPAGSVKDRIALAMIKDAKTKGLIKTDSVIVEPTSGNTGIGLAFVCAAYGYKLILTMPETMSLERRQLMKAYGAELVLTEGTKGMRGAIEKANELLKEIPNAFMPSQFANPANPNVHYQTTGPEIFEDMSGKVDLFVSGIGTGGTITGAGKYLKEKKSNVVIVAVEPADSAILSGEKPGPHGIQGIGAGFVPDVLNTEIYDQIVRCETKAAYQAARELAMIEGILVGISSGAALWAATELAQKSENQEKNIVVILPDTGERYLSTPLFKIEEA